MKEKKGADIEHLRFSEWVDKLQIYQTAMDHEQNVRTAYQSLLTTLEVALFTTVFILKQAGFTHIWVIFVIGIFFMFPIWNSLRIQSKECRYLEIIYS